VPDATDPIAVLLLAVIQGVAEFLPISSSGHLVLGRELMGVPDMSLAFDVALHVGTLAAVLVAYRTDVRQLLGDALQGRFAMAIWLVVATIPIGIVGMALKDVIDEHLRSAQAVGGCLLFTAVLLLVAEVVRARRAGVQQVAASDVDLPEREPSLRDAVIIGCAQVLALAPGVSRSGTTIAAAMLLGYEGKQAARLSFLMSIPAIIGAAVVALPDAMKSGFQEGSAGLIAGAVILSALVGFASLRALVLTLSKGSFRWFAGYCAIMGLAAIFFM